MPSSQGEGTGARRGSVLPLPLSALRYVGVNELASRVSIISFARHAPFYSGWWRSNEGEFRRRRPPRFNGRFRPVFRAINAPENTAGLRPISI